jgi:hypothetical protein
VDNIAVEIAPLDVEAERMTGAWSDPAVVEVAGPRIGLREQPWYGGHQENQHHDAGGNRDPGIPQGLNGGRQG